MTNFCPTNLYEFSLYSRKYLEKALARTVMTNLERKFLELVKNLIPQVKIHLLGNSLWVGIVIESKIVLKINYVKLTMIMLITKVV